MKHVLGLVLVGLISCGDAQIPLQPKGDVPLVVEQPQERPLRRMDLDQLADSIEVVTGGVRWVTVEGGRDVDLFERYSKTLGKPDFVDSNTEDLEASVLFQKFLNDAAHDVCTDLMERELSAPSDERVFFVHAEPEATPESAPEAVANNLSMLLLRYHAKQIVIDDARLQPWLWLMNSVLHVTEDDALQAWGSVCVALIVHPDFYSY